jgi:hypothetical protein
LKIHYSKSRTHAVPHRKKDMDEWFKKHYKLTW